MKIIHEGNPDIAKCVARFYCDCDCIFECEEGEYEREEGQYNEIDYMARCPSCGRKCWGVLTHGYRR